MNLLCKVEERDENLTKKVKSNFFQKLCILNSDALPAKVAQCENLTVHMLMK